MTTVCSGTTKAEISALQNEIEFYRNLIAQHEKRKKSEMQCIVANHGSMTSNALALHNTLEKVPTLIGANISQSNGPNQLAVKFVSKNLKWSPNSLGAPNGSFKNRTVVKKWTSPAPKASTLISTKLPVKPIIKNSSLPNISKLQSMKSTDINKFSTPDLKNNLASSFKNAACLQSKIKTPKKNSKSKEICKEIIALTEQIKQASKTLSIKNANVAKSRAVLSKNSKLFVKSNCFSNLNKDYRTKNISSNVSLKSSLSSPLPKLPARKLQKNNLKLICSEGPTKMISPSSCIIKDSVLAPLQNIDSKKDVKIVNGLDGKLYEEKAVGSKPKTLIKLIKRPLNAQLISTPMKAVGTPVRKPERKVTKLVSSKFKVVNKNSPCPHTLSCAQRLQNVQIVPTPMKVTRTPVVKPERRVTKLISSKFKVVNKNSPYPHTLISVTSPLKKSLNSACKLQFRGNQWSRERGMQHKPFKTKTHQLYSEYKIINKRYSIENLKSNLAEFPSKNFKTSKDFVWKQNRKSAFKYVNERKELITANKTSSLFKSNSMTSFHQLSGKLHPKTCELNTSFKAHIPLKKPKVPSLNSCSKYKVVNEPLRALNKNLETTKLFNFSTDVDLLRELAAEKNSYSTSTSKLKDRHVLLKRVYKSKKSIINQNVSSSPVKMAKMIKSKYLSCNRRHLGYKQAKFRNYSNFKHFHGLHNPTNFYSSPYYNHRTRRNYAKHKKSNYTNVPYFSQHGKMHYPLPKPALGAFKSFKRMSGNRMTFPKTSYVKKLQTPVKSLASRVLQHSINRVLTASVKKKMSKVNAYCMFYNRFGRCNNGSKCTYIHDPSKIAICTRFLRGTCKMKNCLFSHEICPGKMAICSFFLSGSCTKPNCPYRHEMLSPDAELCKAFVQGYCPEGKECKKAHILICPEYVQGSCSKGNACAFPHPPAKEKKIMEKTTEKYENLDTGDILMERVSRYFQPSSKEVQFQENQASSNSVVPKRKNLPEQPSFISLSFNDCES